MKHHLKFFLLTIIIMTLIVIFVWDRKNVNKEIMQIQSKINSVEQQLREGSGIMNEIEKIQQFFSDKKSNLITYHISGSELAAEIKNLNDLSKKKWNKDE